MKFRPVSRGNGDTHDPVRGGVIVPRASDRDRDGHLLSGRATGLAAFWYLAAFLLYLRASRPEQNPHVLSWALAGAIGCFVLALLSKETAITFPLALLLAECVARRTRSSALRMMSCACTRRSGLCFCCSSARPR